MSFIGTLEQFTLSNVLQRIETHEKSGLLRLKQGQSSIDFFFRGGRLLCIGPLRSHATLGERLFQDGVISAQALQEVRQQLSPAEQSETRMALALMERSLVSREQLRTWAILKASDVLRALLVWTSGELHFEEATPPPADRLLVSMSVTELIASASITPNATVPVPTVSAPPQQKTQTAQPAPSQALRSHQPLFAPPARTVQPSPAPVQSDAPAPVRPPEAPARATSSPAPSSPAIERVPTLTSASQFFEPGGLSAASLITSLPATEALSPVGPPQGDTGFPSLLSDTDASGFSSLLSDVDDSSFATLAEGTAEKAGGPLMQPVPVAQPAPARRIDTSFMRPDMVLVPVDLSAFREQNPQVQLTPEQWRVLTYADGRTSLQTICQEIGISPEPVCIVAGELMAEGLIYVSAPDQLPRMQELSPVSRELIASGFGNGYVAPGYGTAHAAPWSAPQPAYRLPDTDQHLISTLPFEAESQWGNGGNGAMFIPGRGWITAHQPAQSVQTPSGPLPSHTGIYAQVR